MARCNIKRNETNGDETFASYDYHDSRFSNVPTGCCAATRTNRRRATGSYEGCAPASYPPIARQARARGKVVVEVKINAAGDVAKSKAVEGHPLLQKTAEAAAAQWTFVSGADNRKAQLSFAFIAGEGETDKISFIPPYQVEYVSRRPVILAEAHY